MSKAANVHKGHDEACTGEEAESLFSGDCPVVLAHSAKGHFHSQSWGGFLGATDSREYLITS